LLTIQAHQNFKNELSLPNAAADADRLCDEGYTFLEAGRFEEARALLLRARALAADNPLIHYRLGLLYSDIGRPAEALEALDASLRLQTDNARAHNNRGSALQLLGRTSEAEQAFQRALDLSPELEPPYINLGHALEMQGKLPEAVALYELAIARGLDAALFGHYLAAASAQVTDRAPDRWVSATFDNFAPTFDAHLRQLGYAVPRLLAALVRSHVDEGLDIVDLGCGTGQCGIALAQQKRYLAGVDLSDKMLAHARALGIYDDLHMAEVHAWLRGSATARFDLVIAADVFIYIGALEELFREAGRILRPGGWFAFSTEECELEDYVLRPTGRYAQSETYIRRLAEPTFVAIAAEPAVIRLEMGNPLAGRLFLLKKP
jgi:predicted TPR repeat methyltransferase